MCNGMPYTSSNRTFDPMKISLAWLLLMPLNASAIDRDFSNAVQTGAGIYSSIYAHELGHALAMKAMGASDIHIQVPRPGGIFSGQTSGIFKQESTPGQRQLLAASGLLTANLAAELIMQRTGLHDSAYAQSILGTSLISNLIHVTHYYTKTRGINGYAGNDIDQFELADGNPHVMAAVLTGYTLWTLNRMQKQSIPLFYVKLKF